MSEPQEETAETPSPVETTPPEGGGAADESSEDKAQKPTETVEFWKTKAREQEKRAKENASAAKRLTELEESQKSELQKAVERAEAAEGTLATLQAAQQISDWKSEVSQMKEFEGVPPSHLRGTSLEELMEHAAQLKSLLPEPRKPGQVPAEGRTVTPGTGDPAQQFAELIRNARKG